MSTNQPTDSDALPRHDLFGLLDSWKKRSSRKFIDAKNEDDDMGRRLIEHGAMCYFNAATELEEVLKQIPLPELGEPNQPTKMKPTDIEKQLAEARAKAEEAAKAKQEAELLAAELEAKKAKIGNLPDYSTSIAPTLERLVSEAGMTIYAVAVAAGLPAPTIYSVIRSQSSPRLITLAKISRVLGMSLSELMVEYERDLGREAVPQEDAKTQVLPEPWMEPLPPGPVLIGKEGSFKVPEWYDENGELYYAVPTNYEIAKLNGL